MKSPFVRRAVRNRRIAFVCLGFLAAGIAASVTSQGQAAWGQSQQGANGVWRREADPALPPHQAATLPDGRILVVQPGPSLEAPIEELQLAPFFAQIYDPLGGNGSGSWADAARPIHVQGWVERLAFSLKDHCLPSCGKVLVRLGGHPGTWKLYDPLVNVWIEAVPVFSRNHGITAGIIEGSLDQCGARCGMVVASGGGETSPPEDQGPVTAEIFDPKSGSWSLTTPPPGERWNGVTTSLGDGRVLFMYPDYGHAEFYDGLTGLWSPSVTPPPLGVGQSGQPFPDPVLLSTGKVLAFTLEGAAKIFDPKAGPMGSWSDGPACTVCGGTVTALPSGKVLIAGGHANSPTNRAEIFDPEANGGKGQFIPTGSLNFPGGRLTATLIEGPFKGLLGGGCGAKCGSVLISGGNDWESQFTSGLPTELYTPAPEIDSVSPDKGPSEGGTVVEITGSGLASASAINFGAKGGVKVQRDNTEPDRKLTVTTPPHPAALVPVSVKTLDEIGPAIRPDAFTFLSRPTTAPPPPGPEPEPLRVGVPPAAQLTPPQPPVAPVSGPSAIGPGIPGGAAGASSSPGGGSLPAGPLPPAPPGGSAAAEFFPSAVAGSAPSTGAASALSPSAAAGNETAANLAAPGVLGTLESLEPAPRFSMVRHTDATALLSTAIMAAMFAIACSGRIGTKLGGAASSWEDGDPQPQLAYK